MKNKNKEIDRSDNYFDEVPGVNFVVKPNDREIFEDFCMRNQIPFLEEGKDEEEIIYLVRAGIDEMDVYTYMLYMTHIPDEGWDEEIWITLRMMRMYYVPNYEYEHFVFRTEEDKWRLEHFDDHWWPGNDDMTK